jgi:hypothetical protein
LKQAKSGTFDQAWLLSGAAGDFKFFTALIWIEMKALRRVLQKACCFTYHSERLNANWLPATVVNPIMIILNNLINVSTLLIVVYC